MSWHLLTLIISAGAAESGRRIEKKSDIYSVWCFFKLAKMHGLLVFIVYQYELSVFKWFHYFDILEWCNTQYYKWDEEDKKLKDLGVAQNVF